MQYPQANPPSRQGLQRIDPSTIIPPVEALGNQNKNYHYYDSNTGRMQNIVNENVKQIPGNTHATLPNASGDMQPIVEN
ncbi:hypothetical protein QE152_g4283 [Popillia japonica]|uniref:Uncharacterized protein n=1 Tax=Popillia japonica TaxID=7064 RepID=A0AAW1MZ06_POPJA